MPFSLSSGNGRRSLPTLIPRCGQCQLFTGCKSPKMKTDGEGRRKIYVMGEAPGANEDARNQPFVGKAGDLLESTLAKFGVDLRKDCWIGNSLRCRPPNNRDPKPQEIDYCRPFLLKDLEELKPELIIPLGSFPIKSLIGHVWREDPGGAGKWAGFQVPCQKPNAWICPTFHPSHVQRSEGERGGEVVRLFFERHLAAALALEGRPWDVVPEWEKEVQIIMSPREAADKIQEIAHSGRIAWDLETTTIKPDGPHAEIYTCSISDGNTTVAFPWQGKAVDAMLEVLRDKTVAKVGTNIKFETRWLRRKHGVTVKGWEWDTMLAAHWADNREGICSVKLQAFALLGQPAWDAKVGPYLESKGRKSNTPNRIKEANLVEVLRYNGVDSLVEYKVGERQRELGRYDDGRG